MQIGDGPEKELAKCMGASLRTISLVGPVAIKLATAAGRHCRSSSHNKAAAAVASELISRCTDFLKACNVRDVVEWGFPRRCQPSLSPRVFLCAVRDACCLWHSRHYGKLYIKWCNSLGPADVSGALNMQGLWLNVVQKRWPQVGDDALAPGEGISGDGHLSGSTDMVAAEYIADAHRAVKRLGNKLAALAMSSSPQTRVAGDVQQTRQEDDTPPIPKRKLSNSGKKSGKKCQRPLQDSSPDMDGGKIRGINTTADSARCESSDDEDEYVIESTAP